MEFLGTYFQSPLYMIGAAVAAVVIIGLLVFAIKGGKRRKRVGKGGAAAAARNKKIVVKKLTPKDKQDKMLKVHFIWMALVLGAIYVGYNIGGNYLGFQWLIYQGIDLIAPGMTNSLSNEMQWIISALSFFAGTIATSAQSILTHEKSMRKGAIGWSLIAFMVLDFIVNMVGCYTVRINGFVPVAFMFYGVTTILFNIVAQMVVDYVLIYKIDFYTKEST